MLQTDKLFWYLVAKDTPESHLFHSVTHSSCLNSDWLVSLVTAPQNF